MTKKDFKTLTGLFVVMLSFGLLYSFNMVEPDYAENVYSEETTAVSEDTSENSTEQETNGTVSASTIDDEKKTGQEPADESSVNEEMNGFISSGMLNQQMNYEVSGRNWLISVYIVY